MIFSFIKLVTIEGLDWSPILAGRAEWLDRPFSEEDFHNVVLHLNKKKRPLVQMVLQLLILKRVGRQLRMIF